MPSEKSTGSPSDRSSGRGRPDLDAFIGESQIKAARQSEQHAIDVLSKKLGLKRTATLVEFNKVSGLPFVFGACHIYGGMPLLDILFRPTRTELWPQFLDLRDSAPDDTYKLALIFNSHGHGIWIMHNYATAACLRLGKSIVCGVSDWTIVAQPLTDFCEKLRLLTEE